MSRRAFSPFSLALFLGSVPGLWHPAAPGFLIWVLGAALGGRNSLLTPTFACFSLGKPQTTQQVEESLSSRWFFFFPTAGTLSSVVKRCSDCCVSPLNIRFAEAPARAIRRDDHLIVIGYGRQRSEAQFPELLTLFGAFKNPETSFSGRFMARCSVP